jgi:kinesin family member C2/C3
VGAGRYTDAGESNMGAAASAFQKKKTAFLDNPVQSPVVRVGVGAKYHYNNQTDSPAIQYSPGLNIRLTPNTDRCIGDSDAEAGEVLQVRAETMNVLYNMIPHHTAPTMRSTIMDTVRPLLTESVSGTRYCLEYQDNERGDSILHVAVQYFMTDLIEYIVSLGDVHAVRKCLHVQNFHGSTCLHLACTAEYLSVETAECFIMHGAQPDSLDNEGCTPLHYAASAGDLSLCKLLVEHGSDNRMDMHNYTPFDYALLYCHYDCANFLKLTFGPFFNSNATVEDMESKNASRNVGNQEASDDVETCVPTQVPNALNQPTRQVNEWVEYWCLDNQAYYYYNTLSYESVWEAPACFEQPATYHVQLSPTKISSWGVKDDSLPVSPLHKWKAVARSVGKQKRLIAEHGFTASPLKVEQAPQKKESLALEEPGKSSIEKEITKLIRVVESSRYSREGENTTELYHLEQDRLHELEMQYKENENAIDALHKWQETAGPESNEDGAEHSKRMDTEEEMLQRRKDIAQAMKEQMEKTEKAEQECLAHKAAYDDAMKKIELLKSSLKQKEQIIKDSLGKASTDKEISRQLHVEQANALKEAKDEARHIAEEHQRLRAIQAEDKRQLMEARERINRQKSAESEAKLMAERLQIIEEENARLKSLETENRKLKEDFAKEHKKRVKVHNELESMKGSIRVLARVRPLSKSETKRGCTSVVQFPAKNTISVLLPPKREGVAPVIKEYEFDTCFPASATQDDVFTQVAPLIQSSLDGFNVCIFAYGQTGSGKTFTMTGPNEPGAATSSLAGVTPRAIHLLFEAAKAGEARFKVDFTFTMVELYRGEIIDLLYNNAGGNKGKKKYTVAPKLSIKKDLHDCVYVDNATEKRIDSMDALSHCMDLGNQQRKTASTLMNSESSRSHLVMTIRLNSTNKITGIETVGKLTLVDLAGSERQTKTGSTGDALKEAQSINKSLSALGNVISAITSKSKHIPYRDDPLTQMLSDSIGGNAKTLMFVNLSPANYNAEETNNTLVFGRRVKSVTNNSQKNVQNKEIKMLKQQLERLKKQAVNPAR